MIEKGNRYKTFVFFPLIFSHLNIMSDRWNEKPKNAKIAEYFFWYANIRKQPCLLTHLELFIKFHVEILIHWPRTFDMKLSTLMLDFPTLLLDISTLMLELPTLILEIPTLILKFSTLILKIPTYSWNFLL